MGKTEVLRAAASGAIPGSCGHAANPEPGAEYTSVRDFNVLGGVPNKTLYLDGLDEVRAGQAGGQGEFDQLRKRLNSMGRPSFRLACRAADWYGAIDRNDLAKVSPNGEVIVLQLEPLTDEDIQSILAGHSINPKSFFREAEQRGISDLLHNPQTLNMVIQTATHHGTLPGSRYALYDSFCDQLVTEQNQAHAHVGIPISTENLRASAGALCAAHLCSDTVGLALNQVAADTDYPLASELVSDIDAAAALAVVRRSLFTAVGTTGSEQVVPCHRTVAEFLAAEHIARRIKQGIPVARALSLVTTLDGGVPTSLRGLCGWLATHSDRAADALIYQDPFGLVTNGDAGQLSPQQRRRLLDSISHMEERNPACRAGYWSGLPFGALASGDMASYFKSALADAVVHPVRAMCVLDAIEHGTPLPEMGDRLLDTAGGADISEELRVGAVDAFIHACPEQLADLRQVVESIRTGNLPDAEGRLRTAILRHLYPELVGPEEIVDFLGDFQRFPGGSSFSWFIAHTLPESTPIEGLPTLLDVLASTRAPDRLPQSHAWSRLLGRTLVAGLTHWGDRVPWFQLWRWLGIGQNKYGNNEFEREESDLIQKWFQARPKLVEDLFHHWFIHYPGVPEWGHSYKFWRRLREPGAPPEFARWLFWKATGTPEQGCAEFLFYHAVRLTMFGDDNDPLTLDELLAYTRRNPRFAAALRPWLYSEIEDWRTEHANHMREIKGERKRNRAETLKNLAGDLEAIRLGQWKSALWFLGRLYYGQVTFDQDSKLDDDATPWDRVAAETSLEVAAAAREGFASCLHAPDLPTAGEIIDSYIGGSVFHVTPAALAGMDEIAAGSPTAIDSLPDSTLQAALLFHLIYSDTDRPWVNWLMRERPTLVAETLEPFWQKLLSLRKEHVPGLYHVTHAPELTLLAEATIPGLLKDFSGTPPTNLDYLLHGALRCMKHDALADLARSVLLRSAVRGTQRLYWLAAAFLLDPEWVWPRLRRFVGKNAERAAGCVNWIASDLGDEQPVQLRLEPGDRAKLVALASRLIRPGQWGRGGGGTVTPTMNAEDAIKQWINIIAADPAPEATTALSKLCGDARLKAWRSSLTHAQAVQLQNCRDQEFSRPTVEQVIATLSGEEPTNPADLQALVVQTLEELGLGWRDGDSDDYKRFWNESPKTGKPTGPKIENSCRDQLIEPLRLRLHPLGIHVDREGLFRGEKRGDLKLFCGEMVLPVEAKRHYHRDLWSAPKKQLVARYTRDPRAHKRGVYVVFWFGVTKARKVPTPPQGIPMPKTAAELKEALETVVSKEGLDGIKVVVFDCTAPIPAKRPKRAAS